MIGEEVPAGAHEGVGPFVATRFSPWDHTCSRARDLVSQHGRTWMPGGQVRVERLGYARSRRP